MNTATCTNLSACATTSPCRTSCKMKAVGEGGSPTHFTHWLLITSSAHQKANFWTHCHITFYQNYRVFLQRNKVLSKLKWSTLQLLGSFSQSISFLTYISLFLFSVLDIFGSLLFLSPSMVSLRSNSRGLFAKIVDLYEQSMSFCTISAFPSFQLKTLSTAELWTLLQLSCFCFWGAPQVCLQLTRSSPYCTTQSLMQICLQNRPVRNRNAENCQKYPRQKACELIGIHFEVHLYDVVGL